MKILGWDVTRAKPVTASTLPPAATNKTVNGTVTWQAGNALSQVQDGFSGNDIVYSIVRLITDKVKVAPWAEYEIKDETALKQFNAIMHRPDLVKDWRKVQDLQHKAMQPVKRGSKLTELLEYPNQDDTWGDIVEQYATFKLVTGNAYTYGQLIGAGDNKGKPLGIFVLPSQYMSIIANLNVFPITPTGYQLYMQFTKQFSRQEILHDKYPNLNWNIVGNQLYGLSPLQAAARVLTRSNEGKKAAVSNYQNGGPKGILFVSDDRHDPQQTVQEAMDLKKTLARNQGSSNVNQVETSGYKVDYVPLGLSPVDLDLLNAEGMDLRALCNIYGVPSQLLNDSGNKSYNNQSEGEKALTTRCAIPMLESIRDNFNRKFRNDWNMKGNTFIGFDASVYQELQENRADQVEWLMKAPLTIGRKLEIMGESTDGYTDEQLNAIIVPSGYATLEEVMKPVSPIIPPQGLNDYNNE